MYEEVFNYQFLKPSSEEEVYKFEELIFLFFEEDLQEVLKCLSRSFFFLLTDDKNKEFVFTYISNKYEKKVLFNSLGFDCLEIVFYEKKEEEKLC
jgi:hypothetical protein